MEQEIKRPGLGLSILVIAIMAAVLISGLILGISTISLLVVNIMVVMLISVLTGNRYKVLESGLIDGIKSAISAVMILLMVGTLVASWIQCGTIPMIIYYGLGWLSPSTILVMTFLLCSILSLFIGSSWGTAGTIGIACVAMATSIGVPVEMAAGAAISGAVLGDKLSPLSDSTILASSICEIDIFQHIRSMLYTTVPSVIIAAAAYLFLGFSYSGVTADSGTIAQVRDTLAVSFNFNILLLLPMIAIVVMSIMKVPSLAAIMISTVIGLLLAFAFQGVSLTQALALMNTGVKMDSGVAVVDGMLSKGGIQSMLTTVCISMLALGLGGILNKVGYLSVIVQKIARSIRTPKGLVLATFCCGVLTLAIVVNFYVAVVLVGTMLREIYDSKGVHRSVLSRTIEEANTMMLPIIPWNASCIYYMGLFGFTSPKFAPYMFLVWANILVSGLYTVNDIAIFRKDEGTDAPVWRLRHAEGNPSAAMQSSVEPPPEST